MERGTKDSDTTLGRPKESDVGTQQRKEFPNLHISVSVYPGPERKVSYGDSLCLVTTEVGEPWGPNAA